MKIPSAIDVMLDHPEILKAVIAGLEERGYGVLSLEQPFSGPYDSEPIEAGPAPMVPVVDVSEYGKPLRLAKPARVPEPPDEPYPNPRKR